MSNPEIDKLASEIASQWQQHEAKQQELLAHAKEAFEPIREYLKNLNDALLRGVQRAAQIKLVKDWSIERGKARCEYEVTMDGIKPSPLSFSVVERGKGRFVEFKNEPYGKADIVNELFALIRTEVSKALKPPKA